MAKAVQRMGKPACDNVGQALASATAILSSAGCRDPDRDACALVSTATGIPVDMLENRVGEPIGRATRAQLADQLRRRSLREPLAYILGNCTFRGLTVFVDRRVLVPEEDSGPLVDAALSLPPNSSVHDVGTGSGAIALAIKSERPDLVVTGSDISPDAISVATANARQLALDVSFVARAGLPDHGCDLVVANLPFEDRAGHNVPLTPEYEVFQPAIAVFGGDDGFAIIAEVLEELAAGECIALKHATSQTHDVHGLLDRARPLAPSVGSLAYTLGYGLGRSVADGARQAHEASRPVCDF